MLADAVPMDTAAVEDFLATSGGSALSDAAVTIGSATEEELTDCAEEVPGLAAARAEEVAVAATHVPDPVLREAAISLIQAADASGRQCASAAGSIDSDVTAALLRASALYLGRLEAEGVES